MIKNFLIIFSILFINFTNSQEREAKIILKDNTNIEGLGEIKKNKIYFRLTPDEKPEVWTEEDAKGIEFTGYRIHEKYVYVIHGKKEEAHLMLVILEGAVELYKDLYYMPEYSPGMAPSMQVGAGPFPSGTVNSVKNIDYYLKRPNDPKGSIVTMDFKKMGRKFFSDCEDLMIKIKEEEFFEEEEIIDLVKYYNHNCGK